MPQIDYAAQIEAIKKQLVFCCNFATSAELNARLAKAQARLADDAQLVSTVEGYETSFKSGTRPNAVERRTYIAARREIARRTRGGVK